MSHMGSGDQPRYPDPPQEMENIILGPPVDDPDYEQDLQRQLGLLNTHGLSGIYLERLGPNGTRSMYRPDIIPFQLNDYMAIERAQIAKMEVENGRLDPDQQSRPKQLQQPGAGWHRLPPASNPLNTPATHHLPQYRQYQAPYPPQGEGEGAARRPQSSTMLPPPRPNVRSAGAPQAPTPPRSGSQASSPGTTLAQQTPQSNVVQRPVSQALLSRSDIIAREPVTFLVPQTPQRPHIQRPEPQAAQPTSFAREARQHSESQRIQAQQSGRASPGLSQDPSRWYIPQHERQRFLPPAPLVLFPRQLYVPRHERAQPPAASPVRDNGTQRPPTNLSKNQQPQPEVQGVPQCPRRGSFARPQPQRELYVPRHQRVAGGNAQSPLRVQQSSDEGDDTDEAEISTDMRRNGSGAPSHRAPPERPLWTRKRKNDDDDDSSKDVGAAGSSQETGGRELWTRKDGSK